MTIALFIWIIAHLIIHETGHVLMTLATGNKLTGFGVSWKGFYMKHSRGSALENVAVALAGPAANLVTYIVLLAVHNDNAWLALWMAVFNLLPLPNSDLLHALVYWRYRNLPKPVEGAGLTPMVVKGGVVC